MTAIQSSRHGHEFIEVLNSNSKLIQEFCASFDNRTSQYSLRGQIIAYYNSILRILEEFPTIRYVPRVEE